MHWGMVIDLRKCIGCGICSVICDQTNGLSYNKWRRVFDCGISGPPERQRMSLPISCMHCSKPPCQEVCPTRATYRRPDGIVDIRYDLCIGCGYCIVACPYHARTIIFQNEYGLEMGAILQESGMNGKSLNRIGVSSKCNFCLSRVDRGLKNGLHPGLDTEATPMCAIYCTSGALHFGDLDDPCSNVSQLIHENKTFFLQEELGTVPSIYYLIE